VGRGGGVGGGGGGGVFFFWGGGGWEVGGERKEGGSGHQLHSLQKSEMKVANVHLGYSPLSYNLLLRSPYAEQIFT